MSRSAAPRGRRRRPSGALVADDVRELARLRNAAARAVGYRDWFAMSVATGGDGRGEADRHARRGRSRHGRAVRPLESRRSTGDSRPGSAARSAELRPWHYADPFFQEVPAEGGVDLDPLLEGADLVELARRTYDGIGLETRAVLDRSDLFPREGKSQHAFCIDIDRAGRHARARNVVPGEHWMDTMLHEFGHAIFDRGLDRDAAVAAARHAISWSPRASRC